MKNVFFFIIVILFAFKDNKSYSKYLDEVIVIKNTFLYNNKKVAIQKLNKFDVLKILKRNKNSKKLLVQTKDNSKGYLFKQYTNFIPKKWIKKKIKYNLAIYLPKNQTFSISEVNTTFKKKKAYQVKYYNLNYYIIAEFGKYSIKDFIHENFKTDTLYNEKIFKKIKLNRLKLYYFSNLSEMDGKRYHVVVFLDSKNVCNSIHIHQRKKNMSLNYRLILFKILFSFLNK